jgi:hypothetical protein
MNSVANRKEDDAMDKTITPSKSLTDGQIDKAVALYRAMLEKHRAELGSEEAQQVLGQSEYVSDLLCVLRTRVEAISKMITRKVDKVDRTKKPQEVLDATKRKQYTDNGVVKSMPHGTGDGAEVIFFKLDRYISDADLEKEYALRGLTAADPYSLAAVNEADPAFADKYPNGTHWQDADGKWCFAAFDRWGDGERGVDVSRGHGWVDNWWFAGVRK